MGANPEIQLTALLAELAALRSGERRKRRADTVDQWTSPNREGSGTSSRTSSSCTSRSGMPSRRWRTPTTSGSMEPGPLETLVRPAGQEREPGGRPDLPLPRQGGPGDRAALRPHGGHDALRRPSKKGLRPPIKLASYGGVWRYDEPQHARYRWFYQWDVEIFGDPSVEADAEVMDFCYNLFKKVGLERFHAGGGRPAGRRGVHQAASWTVSSEEKAGRDDEGARQGRRRRRRTSWSRSTRQKGVDRGTRCERLLEFGRTRGRPDEVVQAARRRPGLGHGRPCARAAAPSCSGTLLRDSRRRSERGVQPQHSAGARLLHRRRLRGRRRAHPDLGSLCGGGRYDVLPRIFGRPDLSATGAAGGVERIALSLEEQRRREGAASSAPRSTWPSPSLRSAGGSARDCLLAQAARGSGARSGRGARASGSSWRTRAPGLLVGRDRREEGAGVGELRPQGHARAGRRRGSRSMTCYRACAPRGRLTLVLS